MLLWTMAIVQKWVLSIIVNGCHIMIFFLGFVIGFNLLVRCHEGLSLSGKSFS